MKVFRVQVIIYIILIIGLISNESKGLLDDRKLKMKNRQRRRKVPKTLKMRRRTSSVRNTSKEQRELKFWKKSGKKGKKFAKLSLDLIPNTISPDMIPQEGQIAADILPADAFPILLKVIGIVLNNLSMDCDVLTQVVGIIYFILLAHDHDHLRRHLNKHISLNKHLNNRRELVREYERNLKGITGPDDLIIAAFFVCDAVDYAGGFLYSKGCDPNIPLTIAEVCGFLICDVGGFGSWCQRDAALPDISPSQPKEDALPLLTSPAPSPAPSPVPSPMPSPAPSV